MPIYEYQSNDESECGFCRDGFEIMQKISEPELTNCPSCGGGITRILSAPSLAKPGHSLDPSNLEKHGFTQYKRAGKGVYEKTAGKGPRVISDDPD